MSVLDLHSHKAIGSAAADLSVQTDYTHQANRLHTSKTPAEDSPTEYGLNCQRYYDGCNKHALTLHAKCQMYAQLCRTKMFRLLLKGKHTNHTKAVPQTKQRIAQHERLV